jgi:hypothetical protein
MLENVVASHDPIKNPTRFLYVPSQVFAVHGLPIPTSGYTVNTYNHNSPIYVSEGGKVVAKRP